MINWAARAFVDEMVRSVGGHDPSAAIRTKARDAIRRFCDVFGEPPELPLDAEALASFFGIAYSDNRPVHSVDAELVPHGDGRVEMRLNPERPHTRRRFSIGHEISHTFFPNYTSKQWCRTDGRYRHRSNPDDLIEMLCDIGASELVMPLPWFVSDATTVKTGADLIGLAQKYGVSREAAIRRLAETHGGCVAAVFLSWKLKPTERHRFNANQGALFDEDPIERARSARKLRVDYSIPSAAFVDARYYVPADKSVENEGALYEAALSGRPCEGDCDLLLGSVRRRCHVVAVPLWTEQPDAGPVGESGVAAVVKPVDGQAHARPRAARLLDEC